MDHWYERPLDHRAPKGGAVGVDGVERKGGRFLPFYIPRELMPQVYDEDIEPFVAYAERALVELEFRVIDPIEVRPHQRVDLGRAHTIPDAVLDKPCLISSDNYIVDGHHRWAECLHKGKSLHTIRIGLDFEAAIHFVFDYLETKETQK